MWEVQNATRGKRGEEVKKHIGLLAVILLLAGCVETDFYGIDTSRIGEPWAAVMAEAVEDYNDGMGDDVYRMDTDGDVVVLFDGPMMDYDLMVVCWEYWCRMQFNNRRVWTPEEFYSSARRALRFLRIEIDRVEGM